MDTVAVVFPVEHLWFLQSLVRHEMADQERWKIPPTSIELNDQIAESLLRCNGLGLTEAPLLLDRRMCYVIDYLVPNDTKDVNGKNFGKEILLKSFMARRILEGDDWADAAEPDDPAFITRMATWKRAHEE